MPTQMAVTEVPVVTTTEETNEIWEECEDDERPFLVVSGVNDGGYVAKYDMYTIGHNLTNIAANEARRIIEEWVADYESRLRSEDDTPDEIWWFAGKESGSIGEIDEADAKRIVSELSAVVLDDNNWTSAKPDFIAE